MILLLVIFLGLPVTCPWPPFACAMGGRGRHCGFAASWVALQRRGWQKTVVGFCLWIFWLFFLIFCLSFVVGVRVSGVWLSVFWLFYLVLVAFPVGVCGLLRSSLVVCFLAVLLGGSGRFFCWCSWFASGVWLSVFWLLSFVVWVRCFVVCLCGWYGAPQNCQPWLCYQTCNP